MTSLVMIALRKIRVENVLDQIQKIVNELIVKLDTIKFIEITMKMEVQLIIYNATPVQRKMVVSKMIQIQHVLT